MVTPEEAINRISRELSQIYRKKLGRDPDSELIRDEAEHIVEKFGPVMAMEEIFSRDAASGARRRPLHEEEA
jgi:hypothetical protein